MVRNRHLAKRISDAGWTAFRTIVTSTAADAGAWVIAVPAHSTSQDGSGELYRVVSHPPENKTSGGCGEGFEGDGKAQPL
jgi:transposase